MHHEIGAWLGRGDVLKRPIEANRIPIWVKQCPFVRVIARDLGKKVGERAVESTFKGSGVVFCVRAGNVFGEVVAIPAVWRPAFGERKAFGIYPLVHGFAVRAGMRQRLLPGELLRPITGALYEPLVCHKWPEALRGAQPVYRFAPIRVHGFKVGGRLCAGSRGKGSLRGVGGCWDARLRQRHG